MARAGAVWPPHLRVGRWVAIWRADPDAPRFQVIGHEAGRVRIAYLGRREEAWTQLVSPHLLVPRDPPDQSERGGLTLG